MPHQGSSLPTSRPRSRSGSAYIPRRDHLPQLPTHAGIEPCRATEVIQLRIGHILRCLCFTFEDKCKLIIPITQEIFRKVQTCTGGPFGAGEFGQILNHLLVLLRGLDLCKIPYRRPKIRDVFNRPVIEFRIGV